MLQPLLNRLVASIWANKVVFAMVKGIANDYLQEALEHNGKIAIAALVIACASMALSTLNFISNGRNGASGKQVGAVAYSHASAAIEQPAYDRRFSGNSFQEAKLCGTSD